MKDITQDEYAIMRVKHLINWRFPPKHFHGRVRALYSTSPLALGAAINKE
jgi:hypothetical protein